jgi:hypothetical protein
VATDVAVSIDGSGNAHVAAIGLDHRVVYRIRYPTSWSAWETIPDGAATVTASKVAISADTTGADNGTVDLDLIGYGPGGPQTVWGLTKPPGQPFGAKNLLQLSFNKPFTDLAVGQLDTTISGTPTNVELVATSNGDTLTNRLRVGGSWRPTATARTTAGKANLAVNAITTTGNTGIGITTYQ